MITRLQMMIAIAKRNRLAGAIRGCGAWGMSFDQCFNLAPQQLREEYVAANRVARFMEDDCAFFELGPYRLSSGDLVWHAGHKWAVTVTR